MKKQLLLFFLMMLPLVASADAVEINGIWYNLTAGTKQAEVTKNPSKYSGSIIIPEKVTYESIEYTVTSIGKRAFRECSNLTSITIPNSVMSIGESAFSSCFSLKKVIINDLAAWCNIVFSSNPLTYAQHLYSDENTEIKDLVIPDGVTSIGSEAFHNCSGLTSITIPNSVTSIGGGAFMYCEGLASITIPNSVTSIGDNTFASCTNLTSVTIPNSVTSIGDNAFSQCTNLTSVTIPNSVTSIGNNAFFQCTNLTSITIPNSVTSIGYNAFYDIKLSVVVSLIENPFPIESVFYFDWIAKDATLYVPVGTKEKYQATNGWKEFQNIVEGTPTSIKVIENTQNKNATVYDLNGVRLPAPKKGINIINGQKVVVK